MKRINISEPLLGGNELNYVSKCIQTNWISSQGEFVSKFESEFTNYIGSDHSLTTSNGTTALHLALAALGVGSGSEVLVPNLTFAATANAVIHTGATPVLVDVDRDNWTIDIQDLIKKITPRTKAIIPVHIYGSSSQMDEIMSVADQHSLFVIEDNAEALGAEFNDIKLGTIGHIGCFSFFANKIMTTGEGGMVVTNDQQLFEKMLILRDHGMERHKRYWHLYPGFNYRMTNLQAAIGLAQLQQLPSFLEKRRWITGIYDRELSDLKEIQAQTFVPNSSPVCWLYSIIIDHDHLGLKREHICNFLEKQGIDTRYFFFPLHRQPPYSGPTDNDLPNSSWIADRGISLPTHVQLSESDIVFICDQVRAALRQSINESQ